MRCWDTSKAYQTESELTQAGFLMAIQVDLILLCFILLHFADCFFANGNLCKIWQLQVVKNPPASAGDARELGSIPGVGDGNPLQ